MDKVYKIAEEIHGLSPSGMVVETYLDLDFTLIIFTYKSDRAQIAVVDNTVMVTIYTSTTDKLGWNVWKEKYCSFDINSDFCRNLMLDWISVLNKSLSKDNV